MAKKSLQASIAEFYLCHESWIGHGDLLIVSKHSVVIMANTKTESISPIKESHSSPLMQLHDAPVTQCPLATPKKPATYLSCRFGNMQIR